MKDRIENILKDMFKSYRQCENYTDVSKLIQKTTDEILQQSSAINNKLSEAREQIKRLKNYELGIIMFETMPDDFSPNSPGIRLQRNISELLLMRKQCIFYINKRWEEGMDKGEEEHYLNVFIDVNEKIKQLIGL